jgi:membrane-associated phospholipid phosphatase
MNNEVDQVNLPPSASRLSAWRSQQTLWLSSLGALGLFLLLTAAVSLAGQPYFGGDLKVTHAVQSISWPCFEPAMLGLCKAGDNLIWSSILVALACIAVLAFRAWREAAVLLGVVLVGQILKISVKDFIDRPRPQQDVVRVLIDAKEIYSFPSGHTVHYTVFFGFLWFLTFALVNDRKLRWPLLAIWAGLILGVGLARIYLGAHWVSDVLGGYLLGGSVLSAGVAFYRVWSAPRDVSPELCPIPTPK